MADLQRSIFPLIVSYETLHFAIKFSACSFQGFAGSKDRMTSEERTGDFPCRGSWNSMRAFRNEHHPKVEKIVEPGTKLLFFVWNAQIAISSCSFDILEVFGWSGHSALLQGARISLNGYQATYQGYVDSEWNGIGLWRLFTACLLLWQNCTILTRVTLGTGWFPSISS